MNHTAKEIALGIHFGMPAQDYHALPGGSPSRLKHFLHQPPAKARQELENPDEPTIQMAMGTLVHSITLEDAPLRNIALQPDTYPAPAHHPDVKKGLIAEGYGLKWAGNAKWCKAWVEEQKANGCLILKQDEVDALIGAKEALRKHPDAVRLLSSGRAEVSLIAEDEGRDGMIVRSRLDFLPDSEPDALADLKFTNDASPEGFSKKIFDLGYHMQAALSLDLWNALAGSVDPRHRFIFIAVEQKPPHLVACYEATPDMIERGRLDWYRCLNTYWNCLRTGEWPGYPTGINPIGLPRWANS